MRTQKEPLFFIKTQQLYAGSVAKGNARLIVPFEFYGKLYYGLTATIFMILNQYLLTLDILWLDYMLMLLIQY